MSTSPNFPDIRNSARKLAPDFYLSALLAPQKAQVDLIALAALIGEIESIPLKVSEPLIGEIRIQWWRDWLETYHERQSSGVPVADAMAQAVDRHKLPAALVMKMFDAQSSHLYNEPHDSLEKYFSHQADHYGSAIALGGRILTSNWSGELGEAAKAAGHAYGTARLITCLREHAAQGYWPLPPAPDLSKSKKAPLCAKNFAIDREQVEQRRLSVEYTIAAARQELSIVREKIAKLPREILPAFLPLALVEPYFKAFESGSGDPLMMRVELSPLARRWKLWRASL